MPSQITNGQENFNLDETLSGWDISTEEAAKQLLPVSEDKKFQLHEGGDIDGLESLLDSFKSMSTATFSHHVNSRKDDFLVWLMENIHCDKFTDTISNTVIEQNRKLEHYTPLLELYLKALKNIPEIKEILDLGNKIPNSAFYGAHLLHKEDHSPGGELISKTGRILAGNYEGSETWQKRLNLLESIDEIPQLSARQKLTLEVLKGKIDSRNIRSSLQRKILGVLDKFQQSRVSEIYKNQTSEEILKIAPRETKPFEIEESELDFFKEMSFDEGLLITNLLESYDGPQVKTMLEKGIDLEDIIASESYNSLFKDTKTQALPFFNITVSEDPVPLSKEISVQLKHIKDNQKDIRKSIDDEDISFKDTLSPSELMIQSALKPYFKDKRLEVQLDSELEFNSWRDLLYIDNLIQEVGDRLKEYVLRTIEEKSPKETILNTAVCMVEEKEAKEKAKDISYNLVLRLEETQEKYSTLSQRQLELTADELNELKTLKGSTSRTKGAVTKLKNQYKRLKKSELDYEFDLHKENIESLLESNSQLTKNLEEKFKEKINALFGKELEVCRIFLEENNPETNKTIPDIAQYDIWKQKLDQIGNFCKSLSLKQPAKVNKFNKQINQQKKYFKEKLKSKKDIWQETDKLKQKTEELEKRNPKAVFEDLINNSFDKSMVDITKKINFETSYLNIGRKIAIDSKKDYKKQAEKEKNTLCLKTELWEYKDYYQTLRNSIIAQKLSSWSLANKVIAEKPQETERLDDDIKSLTQLIHKTKVAGAIYSSKRKTKKEFKEIIQSAKTKQKFLQKLEKELNSTKSKLNALNETTKKYSTISKELDGLFRDKQDLKSDSDFFIDSLKRKNSAQEEERLIRNSINNFSRTGYFDEPIKKQKTELGELHKKINQKKNTVVNTLDRILEEEISYTTLNEDIDSASELIDKTGAAAAAFKYLEDIDANLKEKTKKAEQKQKQHENLKAELDQTETVIKEINLVAKQYHESFKTVQDLFINTDSLEEDIGKLIKIIGEKRENQKEIASIQELKNKVSRKNYFTEPFSKYNQERGKLANIIEEKTKQITENLNNIVYAEVPEANIDADMKLALELIEKKKKVLPLLEKFEEKKLQDLGEDISPMKIKAESSLNFLEDLLKDLAVLKTATTTVGSAANEFLISHKTADKLFTQEPLTEVSMNKDIESLINIKIKTQETKKQAKAAINSTKKCRRSQYLYSQDSPFENHGYGISFLENKIKDKINRALYILDDNIKIKSTEEDINKDIESTKQLIGNTECMLSLYPKLEKLGIKVNKKLQTAGQKLTNLQTLLTDLETLDKVRGELFTAKEKYGKLYINTLSLFNPRKLEDFALEEDINSLAKLNSEFQQVQQQAESAIKSTENCQRKHYLDKWIKDNNHESQLIQDNVNKQITKVKSTLDAIIDESVPEKNIVDDIMSTNELLAKTEQVIEIYPLFENLDIDTDKKLVAAKNKHNELKKLASDLNQLSKTGSVLYKLSKSYKQLLEESKDLLNESTLQNLTFDEDISKLDKIKSEVNKLKAEEEQTSIKSTENCQRKQYINHAISEYNKTLSRIETQIETKTKLAVDTLDNIIKTEIPEINIDEDIKATSEMRTKTEKAAKLYLQLKKIGINTDEKTQEAEEKHKEVVKLLYDLKTVKNAISTIDTMAFLHVSSNSSIDKLFQEKNLENLTLEQDIQTLVNTKERLKKVDEQKEEAIKLVEKYQRKHYLETPKSNYVFVQKQIEDNINSRINKAINHLDNIIAEEEPLTSLKKDIKFVAKLITQTEQIKEEYLKFEQFGVEIKQRIKNTEKKHKDLEKLSQELEDTKKVIANLTKLDKIYDDRIETSEQLFSRFEDDGRFRLTQEVLDLDIGTYKKIKSNIEEHKPTVEKIQSITSKFSRKYSMEDIITQCLTKDTEVKNIMKQRIDSVINKINSDIANYQHLKRAYFADELDAVEDYLTQAALAVSLLENSIISSNQTNIKSTIESNIAKFTASHKKLKQTEQDRAEFESLKPSLKSYSGKLEEVGKKRENIEEDKESIRKVESDLKLYFSLAEEYKDKPYLEDVPPTDEMAVSFEGYIKIHATVRASTIADTEDAIKAAKHRVINHLPKLYIKEFDEILGSKYFRSSKIFENSKIQKLIELREKYDQEIGELDSDLDLFTLDTSGLRSICKYVEKQREKARKKSVKSKDMSKVLNYDRKYKELEKVIMSINK